MTIVVRGDEAILEQVRKQLSKVIDTIKVVRFADGDHVEREMALVKVSSSKRGRAEVLEVAHACHADIVDVGDTFITLSAAGTPDQVRTFIELLRPFGVVEMARSGPVAVSRGKRG